MRKSGEDKMQLGKLVINQLISQLTNKSTNQPIPTN